MRNQKNSAGSAFVFDSSKRLILTNAHVVQEALTLHVRRPGNPKKFAAEVLCESKHCDLALLPVKDDLFWKEALHSLVLDTVPDIQHSIWVAGYPLGGDQLSVTKGIVSRVTMPRYSSVKLLGVQIDAAINPGNSGGPAFSDLEGGKVAGVSFAKVSSADNVGYIIPYQIVDHFMSEYNQYGEFRGMCSTGFLYQVTENTHLRSSLKMTPDMTGVMIYEVDPLSPALGILKPKDVVLEIDGVQIADDATITFRNDERVEFLHLVRQKHIGDKVELKLLREGKILELQYELQPRQLLVPAVHGLDCFPQYFIFGGLVFAPLTVPFLQNAYGSDYHKKAPSDLQTAMMYHKEYESQQIVVLVQILASELTFGYKFGVNRLVTVNDEEIKNISHLTTIIDNCKEQDVEFGLMFGKKIILNRKLAKEAGSAILQEHKVPQDRSDDLMSPEMKKQVLESKR
eukprot:TRINITY_DN4474_c0_g1_i1.p1 TRINITY_DN4474_c0_g1~~TRINITY_DN4474_c0_g1_i1.p1  ORF type:complete len:456 (+),score=81.17 TRINITY_DN4474_c0_g1_i1:382-1749(+)